MENNSKRKKSKQILTSKIRNEGVDGFYEFCSKAPKLIMKLNNYNEINITCIDNGNNMTEAIYNNKKIVCKAAIRTYINYFNGFDPEVDGEIINAFRDMTSYSSNKSVQFKRLNYLLCLILQTIKQSPRFFENAAPEQEIYDFYQVLRYLFFNIE